MSIEKAIWFPSWYESDQPLAVGEVRFIDFFREPPEWIQHDGRKMFYNSSWDSASRDCYFTQKMRIHSIRHPVMGPIRFIDTDGLDYTFLMVDDRIFGVEAEETPGLVYDWPEPSRDWDASKWHIVVELEPTDDPKKILTWENHIHKNL